MTLKSYDCQRCGTNKFPGFVLANNGKLVVECTQCQHTDITLGPADFNTGIAAVPVEGAASGDGWAGKRQVVVDTSAMQPARPAQRAPMASQAPITPPVVQAPAALAPANVIAMLEERAIWLAGEEARLMGERAGIDARLASCRTEAKRLDKMLRAGRKQLAADEYEPTAPQLALVRN